MIGYALRLSGPATFEVRITFDEGRVPLLDVVGFGDQNKPLHAKLTKAMPAAGFALPCYCKVTGPGPKIFRDVFSPGLPLALLVAVMDEAKALAGERVAPRYAWGDLVDGEPITAAGELAVSMELLEETEFIVPQPAKSEPRPVLRRFRFPCDDLDAPQLVKLAIEVGIAARLTTTLVGSPSVLTGWEEYAASCTPQIPTQMAMEHEALLGLWRTPNLTPALRRRYFVEFTFCDPPCVRVGYRTEHDDLIGEIDIMIAEPNEAGLLARAHHGLLLVELVGTSPGGRQMMIEADVLRRISASSLRFAGEVAQLRYTVIASMPACACDPPLGLPCRCSSARGPKIATQRRRVISGLPGIKVWGDGGLKSPELGGLVGDSSAAAVRERVARAWAAQDAELGVGVRWGDQEGEPVELITKTLLALGADPENADVLAPLLARRPW